MYNIIFYIDDAGHSEVLDFIVSLRSKSDKTSRVQLKKINEYISALAAYGTVCGKPYLDHLDDEIWELRPHRSRFLFAKDGEAFIILSHFTKDTKTTPRREIEKAKRAYQKYLEANHEESE